MGMYDSYIGQVFSGRYNIRRVIGVGGMAVVFEAYDYTLRRIVALKMIKQDVVSDSQAVTRFVNESKAVSMLNHPNIVKIYDVSFNGPQKYFTMELINGITLKSYIAQKGALPVNEVLSFSRQILNALEHAHSKGIIHRDIKPQNILLLANGTLKVTDFGIAKLPDTNTLTKADQAIGTVYYISPEQASGHNIDPRSDLYSLGIVMYEMATGVLPFNSDSPIRVAMMQISESPKAPRERNPHISVGLEQIILGAMAKKPANRFQSAAQMRGYVVQLERHPDYQFKKIGSIPGNHGPEKQQSAREKKKSMLPIIMGVAAAFLIVIGVSGVYVLTRLMSGPTEESITVVNLVGETYSETMKAELESGYYRVRLRTVYDASCPENTIISQSPEGGVKRKVIAGQQYCELELKVSMGAETKVLKDYTIMEWRKVENELRSLGLRVVKNESTTQYHDTVPEGFVIRTDPVAGTVLREGDTVTLYVSRGEQITYTTVPYFIGFDEKNALLALEKADLSLGSVTYRYDDKTEAGIILEQGRSPGIEVPAHATKIDFVVSLGPKPKA